MLLYRYFITFLLNFIVRKKVHRVEICTVRLFSSSFYKQYMIVIYKHTHTAIHLCRHEQLHVNKLRRGIWENPS